MWPVNLSTRSFLLDVRGKFLPHELGKVSIDPTGLSEKPMRFGEGL